MSLLRLFFAASTLPATVLLLAGVATFTCSGFRLDQFLRLEGGSQDDARGYKAYICLIDENTNYARNSIVLVAATALGFLVSMFMVQAGISYFSKELRNGLSCVYARVLLRQPGYPRSILSLLAQPGAFIDNRRFVKLLVVALLVLVPIASSSLSILTGITYKSTTVRIASSSSGVNITSLATWSNVPGMTKRGWYLPGLGVNDSMLEDRTPRDKRTAGMFTTTDIEPIPGRDSGLQTVVVSYPPGTPARRLAAIPISNILLDPVPGNVTDFAITQEVLLVDKVCSYGGFSSEILAEKDGLEVTNVRNSSVTNTYLLSAGYLNSTGWSSTDIAVFSDAQNSRRIQLWGRNKSEIIEPRGRYRAQAPCKYTYGTPANTERVKVLVKTNDTMMSIYTLSQEGGVARGSSYSTPMACRTLLIPIRYNSSISGNLTATRSIPGYEMPGFSKAASHLVNTTMQLTDLAINAMSNASYRCHEMGMSSSRPSYYARGMCRLDKAGKLDTAQAGPLYPIMPFRFQVCEDEVTTNHRSTFTGQFTSMLGDRTVNDSCVGTEYERLLLSHLYFMSMLPPEVPEQQFAWGPVEARFYPDKLMSGVLAGAVVLIMLLMTVVLFLAYVPDSEVVDVAPWAVMSHAASMVVPDMVAHEISSRDALLHAGKASAEGGKPVAYQLVPGKDAAHQPSSPLPPSHQHSQQPAPRAASVQPSLLPTSHSQQLPQGMASVRHSGSTLLPSLHSQQPAPAMPSMQPSLLPRSHSQQLAPGMTSMQQPSTLQPRVHSQPLPGVSAAPAHGQQPVSPSWGAVAASGATLVHVYEQRSSQQQPGHRVFLH